MRIKHFQHFEHRKQKKLKQLPIYSELHLAHICHIKYLHILIFPIQVQKNCWRHWWPCCIAFWLLDHIVKTTRRHHSKRYLVYDCRSERVLVWRRKGSDLKSQSLKNHLVLWSTIIQLREKQVSPVIQKGNQKRKLRRISQALTSPANSPWLHRNNHIFPSIIQAILHFTAEMHSAFLLNFMLSLLFAKWWNC